MNREELKNYLSVAIDALDDEQFKKFSVLFEEPDLKSITNEVVALKGEVKKMNTVSLRLTNELHSLMENSKEEKEKEKLEVDNFENKELLETFNKIIEQDELILNTKKYLENLPEPKSLFNKEFIKQFYGWKSGYEIQTKKWEQFILTIGLKRSGFVGDSFNPEQQEAVETVSNVKFENGIITDCHEIAYFYKNIMLKRGKVTVNKI